MPDPYKVLQVDPEAEDEVIEAAYRRLARKYHPDVAQGADSQERMVRINQAWEMLRDPNQRAAVDRARARSNTAAARAADVDAPGRDSTSHHRPPPAGEPDGGQRQGGRDNPAGAQASSARPAPGWPMPGMRDPSDAESAPLRSERVSRDWTSGRSTTGSTYDPSVMRSPEGQPFPNHGCYLEVVPERRLTWTDALGPGFRPTPHDPHLPFRFTAMLELEPRGTEMSGVVEYNTGLFDRSTIARC